ncbi:MAG: T9SS type A sorting domain-containing protein [Chitinophagaceae bacterium]|nr:T9SS type A sorting domain-containing protein [Chitinophagaceae bacterium]
MKKLFNLNFISKSLFIALLLIGSNTKIWSQTAKITIANGNWSDPNIWSPIGVPSAFIPTDSVIIKHTINYGANLDARGTAVKYFSVNSGASLTGTFLVLGVVDIINNEGTISGADFTFGDINNYFYNLGQINFNTSISQSGTFINKSIGTINSSGATLSTSDTFILEQGSFILVDSFLSSANFTVNGNVQSKGFINGGIITGSTGKICIDNCFINTGDITGTIDICDNSPNTFCDINGGTIAATITNCTSGPCTQTSSTFENYQNTLFNIFPNPTNNVIVIDINEPFADFSIFDLSGKLILKNQIYNKEEINLLSLVKGIYIVKIQTSKYSNTLKLIKQ